MAQPRWFLPDVPPDEVARLSAELGIGMPATRVLYGRGLRDAERAREFLHPKLESLLNPHLLLGMDAALERLCRAIRNGEKILIYGDYDVDGTTSVVVLKNAIELAGGVAEFSRAAPSQGWLRDAPGGGGGGRRAQGVTPHRQRGHGNSRRRGGGGAPTELGIDVIVTDHHLPEAELPPALAVLNPNRPDCAYPEKNLCGVGVAFKLVQGLLATLDWPADKMRRDCESFLKLVAIGTVADVVPLTGENRIIVKHGLDGLDPCRNPGLRALLDVAGFSATASPPRRRWPSSIAPRINAAGRMDTANAVDRDVSHAGCRPAPGPWPRNCTN